MWPDTSDKRLPEIALSCVLALDAQLRTLKVQIFSTLVASIADPNLHPAATRCMHCGSDIGPAAAPLRR